jgi:hypothetical protein
VLSGYEDIKSFLKAPLKEIESSTNKHKVKEWREMLHHLNRKANEVIFMKCTDSTCTVCAGKSWQAKKMYEFLKQRNFKLFWPEESTDHPGHYATFLELYKLPASEIKDDDQNQPSVQAKQLGRCNTCPSYSFSSKTEKKRHTSVYHRKVRGERKHICSFANCGLTFSSYHKLYKHKKQSGHRRKPSHSMMTTPSTTVAQLLRPQEDRNEDGERAADNDECEYGCEDEDESVSEEQQQIPGNSGERDESEVIPNKRPRVSDSIVGRKAKVLYDEGTPNEQWWTAVILDKVNDTNYCLYFLDDHEVPDLAIDEFKLLEEEQITYIGKKLK